MKTKAGIRECLNSIIKHPLKQLLCLFVAATAIAVAACSVNGQHGNGDDNFFSKFETFRGTLWQYADTKTFAVDTLRDSISHRGTLTLALRHTNGFPYRNLWLEVNCNAADTASRPDTLNIILADHFGRWRGHGSGPSLAVCDTIKRNFTLRQGQVITVRHIMRTDTLDGIEQIGITYTPDIN